MKVYKIYNVHDNFDSDKKYIKSDLSQLEIADLLTGLQFYLEVTTTLGECSDITNDMAVLFLCKYYDCIEVFIEEIREAENYYSLEGEIYKDDWIDMFWEREKRTGPSYFKYIIGIKPNQKNTRFF